VHQLDRAHEAIIETAPEPSDALGFEAQHPIGHGEQP
jgi:hypothetical protein